jgi:N-acetyltransferase 10
MKYGSRALELLAAYYQGEITSIDENSDSDADDSKENKSEMQVSNTSLLTEEIKPRKNLPPLLLQLKDRPAERLHYVGVSYGITPQLFSFWKKGGYNPVYLRQTTVCISIKVNLVD